MRTYKRRGYGCCYEAYTYKYTHNICTFEPTLSQRRWKEELAKLIDLHLLNDPGYNDKKGVNSSLPYIYIHKGTHHIYVTHRATKFNFSLAAKAVAKRKISLTRRLILSLHIYSKASHFFLFLKKFCTPKVSKSRATLCDPRDSWLHQRCITSSLFRLHPSILYYHYYY